VTALAHVVQATRTGYSVMTIIDMPVIITIHAGDGDQSMA
jgi:hypothetical protein